MSVSGQFVSCFAEYFLCTRLLLPFFIPPANFIYAVFTLSVGLSVTFCFLNNSKVIAGFSSNLANMFIYAR